MATFVHPALLWGLGLLALPVLIHLINTVRRQPVEWAAMEFLLASQRRSRRWIALKQWLLLAARLVILAAIVLALAQPSLNAAWLSSLGGQRVHHVVLLDDSFSMSDRDSQASAFERAREVARGIAARGAESRGGQVFCLLRASRAVLPTPQPDFWEQPLTSDLASQVQQRLDEARVTAGDARPAQALAAVGELLDRATGDATRVYFVSDFRAADWHDPEAFETLRAQWSEPGIELLLVRAVEQQHGNLAVTALRPLPATRAAGVPFPLEVTVHNFGAEPVGNVAVRLVEDGQARPGLRIDAIAPSKSESRRFQAQFEAAGPHAIEARVEADAIAADDARYLALDLPLRVPVLLVDGSPDTLHARFVARALAPGGDVATGVEPRIESPRYLTQARLEDFHAVFLLNTGYLDPAAIENLSRYVEHGGGVAFFVGDLTDGKYINAELYRDGAGLFPAPLDAPRELVLDRLETPPDIEPSEHPVFRVFAGERNSFLSSVAIERYWGTPRDWRPDPQSDRRVIATLRDGAPLAVERRLGAGRVIAVLTTAAPVWNNWARNPSFVVGLLELQGYLASTRPAVEPKQVGEFVEVTADPAQLEPRAAWRPLEDGAAPASDSLSIDAIEGAAGRVLRSPAVDQPGAYQLDLTTTTGGQESRFFAFNVSPDEGDTKLATAPQLAESLRGVAFEEHPARGFELAVDSTESASLSRWLLISLVGLLLAEQWLGRSASYHPVSRGADR